MCSARPSVQMIRNKTTERLAVGNRLAEIALKCATHAVNFNALDMTGNGKIRTIDLVKLFAKAGAPLSEEEAHAIATMIICRANDDDENDFDARREMDYIEYVHGMENGSMIKFDKFKKMAMKFIAKRGYVQAQSSTSNAKVLPYPSAPSAPPEASY